MYQRMSLSSKRLSDEEINYGIKSYKTEKTQKLDDVLTKIIARKQESLEI